MKLRTTTLPASVPVIATIALTVTSALTSLRLLFPAVYGYKESAGTGGAAAMVLVTVALAMALPVVLRAGLGRRRATVAAVGALAVWRLAEAVVPVTPLVLAMVGVALAFSALVLVLTTDTGMLPRSRAFAVLAGLAADIALMGLFATWDPAWQLSIGSVVAGVALAAGLGAAARHLHRTLAPVPAALAMGGPTVPALLGLELLFLANPAFITATTSSSLSYATFYALGAVVAGVVANRLIGQPDSVIAWMGVAVVAAAGALLPSTTGPGAVLLIVLAQTEVGVVLGRAASAPPTDDGNGVRAMLAVSAGSAYPVLAVLLYQLHYDKALPVPNQLLTALGGLLVGFVVRQPFGAPPPLPEFRRPLPRPMLGFAAAGVLLAVVIGLGSSSPVDPPSATRTEVRVVQWNVHQAVDGDGQLDPDAIAEAIEAQQPVDVVVLNEVGRGWPLSGQLDLAIWLSRRLDLPFVWGPAASSDFGNLVLSRLPVLASEVVDLPIAPDAQERSAIRLLLDRGNDKNLQVVATHLQHRNDEASLKARLAQIDLLLGRFASMKVTVIAGDLNPKQGDPPDYPTRSPQDFVEIRRLLDAGFTTAADLTTCTTPTSNRNCSDYIMVNDNLAQTRLDVVGAGGGDHRLLVADITVKNGV